MMRCERLHGGSIKDCACRLSDGGWLPCPPDAPPLSEELRFIQEVRDGQFTDLEITPKGLRVLDALKPTLAIKRAAEIPDPAGFSRRGRTHVSVPLGQFSGDLCPECGGAKMLRTGTCLTCQDCGGTSGGCS